MKKLLMITVGVLASGAIAQEVAVPVPVVIPQSVDSIAIELETEPGALCRTYLIHQEWSWANAEDGSVVEQELQSATPCDQMYDDKASVFDGRKVGKHRYTVAVWEGVFETKRAGAYVFTIDSPNAYGIKINGVGVSGNEQKSFTVELQKGYNSFWLYRFISRDEGLMVSGRKANEFILDYRLASSTKIAKPIVPSMLKHVVVDDEEW